MTEASLSALSHEQRRFDPPADLAAARQRDRRGLRAREQRPAGVLGRAGRAGCEWAAAWDQVLDWQLPFAKWFVGGRAQRHRSTASTGTSPTASATGSPTTGSASPRATGGPLTYADLLAEVSQGRQRPRPSSASRQATGSASTCR